MNLQGMSWSLGWVDSVGLGLVVVFAVLGVVRGLWWQVVRLLGLMASVAVARGFAGQLRPFVESKLPSLSESTVYGITWFLLFVATLALFSLVGKLGKKSLEALQLGLVDRFGGLLAGIVTAVLIQTALLVGMFELASPEFSRRALTGSYSERLLEAAGGSNAILVDAQTVDRWKPWFLGQPTEVEAGEGQESPAGQTPGGGSGNGSGTDQD